MLRIFPLMYELERRARALGLSWLEVARMLGLTRTALAHIRSGRDRFSLGTLHRIALWFPNDETIQRLVWDYLLHDVETLEERRRKEETRSAEGEALARALSGSSLALLRAFVSDLPIRAVSGTGLLIHSPSTSTLSTALGFVEGELRARQVHVIRQVASAKVAASALPALIAAPVLLVERVEYASPSMAAVLRSRSDYLKVTVATTAGGDGTGEAPLLRLLGSRMSRAPVESAPSPMHV